MKNSITPNEYTWNPGSPGARNATAHARISTVYMSNNRKSSATR